MEDKNREDLRYECIKCGDIHHPDERKEHEFRVGVTVCPKCGGKRKRVVHDYDGPVTYNEH